MTSQNSQQRVSWKVALGESPLKGSRAMYQTLPFASQNPITIDLTYELESARIEFVQALFVDNSANPSVLSINMHSSQQRVIIPSYSQAYIPVLASEDNCKIQFSTVGSATVPIEFLSFPVAPLIWSVSSPGSTGTDYSANKPVLLANIIATAPVNSNRLFIEVQNQSGETIQVVKDDGAGNNVSIILLAPGAGAGLQGGDWTSSTFKGRVRVYATTTADQVMMYED